MRIFDEMSFGEPFEAIGARLQGLAPARFSQEMVPHPNLHPSRQGGTHVVRAARPCRVCGRPNLVVASDRHPQCWPGLR